MKIEKTIDLDKLNKERVVITKNHVRDVINIVSNPIRCLLEGRLIDSAVKDIAHATNILESNNEYMRYACEYFEWNQTICDDIDDVCGYFGECLALILSKDEKDSDFDEKYAGALAEDGLNLLGKILASLINWFDEDESES